VANEEGRALAAVDLTAFAVIRHVPLDGAPTEVIAHPSERVVYALTPDTGVIHEVAAEGKLQVRRKTQPGAFTMRLSRDGEAIFTIGRSPRALVRIDQKSLKPNWRVALPADPTDFDVAPNGSTVAVSFGAGRFLWVGDAKTGANRTIQTEGDAGSVRFQSDGRTVLLGDTSNRQLSLYDVASGRTVAHLPLAVRPENFCFKPDGGQLFVTGDGMDAVVVVYPYHTPQVAETVLAGRAPGAMAASDGNPGYLFVSNPESGDVTILNITTRKVVAVANVGNEPGCITITPDNQYALVLNRKSGDMAVLLISDKLVNRQRSAALFTMIPVGSKPVSAAVRRA
jgi:YVTN family beta-propeller protein